MEGETFIFSKADYEVIYIKPCKADKSKKIAKVRLKFKPDKNFYKELEDFFGNAEYFPKLGLVKIEFEGKKLMVFDSGEAEIMEAENGKDVIKTADLLVRVLKG